MADIKYEVKKDFGNIGKDKRFTLTSWNGKDAKYDIRNWTDQYVGKGITLSEDEIKRLYLLLKDIYMNNLSEKPIKAEYEASGASEGHSEMTDLPEKIKSAFDELDKFFKGCKVSKKYDVMEFAEESGKRFQYYVTGKYPKDYEKLVKKLELESFVTDKGNLFIYTLKEEN